jgi:hypothetical protein
MLKTLKIAGFLIVFMFVFSCEKDAALPGKSSSLTSTPSAFDSTDFRFHYVGHYLCSQTTSSLSIDSLGHFIYSYVTVDSINIEIQPSADSSLTTILPSGGFNAAYQSPAYFVNSGFPDWINFYSSDSIYVHQHSGPANSIVYLGKKL